MLRKQQRSQKRYKKLRGGAPPEPIGNKEAIIERQKYEMNAFKKQLNNFEKENQAGIPRLEHLLKLLIVFNQSTELIKNKKMRKVIKEKIHELDNYHDEAIKIHIQQNSTYQQLRPSILERIRKYNADAAAAEV